ncbi:iron chelate uptake ABC transporter family permease subunit, partial [Escherichia coli]|uniref:iron chelate uptake ABC transporter family permease subunit n=1 Tax=Escherichia coli TaxID=562 RepID=UPI0013D326A1
LARMLGLARARVQIAGAALIGALVMVGADWVGRTIIFPYELSAGLVAALIGMPYLVWQLSRGR